MTESPCTRDPLPSLVSDQDPDWARYLADDAEYFLRAAGALIRVFCGWHVAPNITQTVDKLSVGTRGLIMLPSRHVTNVEQITVYHGGESHEGHTLQPDEYLWHEAGWIERKGQTFYNDGWAMGAYYFGNDPYYLPVAEPGHALVTFTHGFDTLPADVKEIVFEIAEQAMAIRTGNFQLLEAPLGFRLQTTQNAGVSLNPEQVTRLSNWRVGMVL